MPGAGVSDLESAREKIWHRRGDDFDDLVGSGSDPDVTGLLLGPMVAGFLLVGVVITTVIAILAVMPVFLAVMGILLTVVSLAVIIVITMAVFPVTSMVPVEDLGIIELVALATHH